MVKVEWQGGMKFESTPPSGSKLVLDALPDVGGGGEGPSPVETLLSAIGACAAMDVISILKKKRQVVTAYRIEIEGERVPPGNWPRPFLSIVVRHIVSGENIDPAAVERAVQLSDEKYCSVIATLRQSPTVTSEWVVE
ncbi:MAG TPA: OsmC family protein [Fimbriimonadaceae bacterium]|nr:OsmC family protein [Fimbriimonadaceae bacterium]HRJ95512.1 OsmC family protein [Fimbriimonadaceae bacterium]